MMSFHFHIRVFISGLALVFSMPHSTSAAPTVEEGMRLGGRVTDMCRLAAPIAVGGGVNASFVNVGTGASQVQISTLASEEDAVLNPASISLDFDATCNYAHSVTLQSQKGGLKNEDPSATGGAGFRLLAGYAATLIWGGISQDLNVSGAAGVNTVLNQGGATHGIISVLIQIPGGGDPLVSGAYSDLLVLEFGSTL